MPALEVLRVFTGDDGAGGNLLGVFGAGHGLADDQLQAVAADLGFSETVFVADAARGELRIFTPAVELPLAGHPLVGAGRLLGVDVLRPPAGDIPTCGVGAPTGIRADPDRAPEFERITLGSPEAVDAHPRADAGHVQVWA